MSEAAVSAFQPDKGFTPQSQKDQPWRKTRKVTIWVSVVLGFSNTSFVCSFLLKQVYTCWLTAVPGVLDTCSLFSSLALNASSHQWIWFDEVHVSLGAEMICRAGKRLSYISFQSHSPYCSNGLRLFPSQKIKGRSVLVIKIHPLVTQGDLD